MRLLTNLICFVGYLKTKMSSKLKFTAYFSASKKVLLIVMQYEE